MTLTVFVGEVTFNSLHWLFEAQDNDVNAKVLGSSNIQLYGLSRPSCDFVVTPFDCFVLGYCMSHSNCSYLED